jgi:hypothetical protein
MAIYEEARRREGEGQQQQQHQQPIGREEAEMHQSPSGALLGHVLTQVAQGLATHTVVMVRRNFKKRLAKFLELSCGMSRYAATAAAGNCLAWDYHGHDPLVLFLRSMLPRNFHDNPHLAIPFIAVFLRSVEALHEARAQLQQQQQRATQEQEDEEDEDVDDFLAGEAYGEEQDEHEPPPPPPPAPAIGVPQAAPAPTEEEAAALVAAAVQAAEAAARAAAPPPEQRAPAERMEPQRRNPRRAAAAPPPQEAPHPPTRAQRVAAIHAGLMVVAPPPPQYAEDLGRVRLPRLFSLLPCKKGFRMSYVMITNTGLHDFLHFSGVPLRGRHEVGLVVVAVVVHIVMSC